MTKLFIRLWYGLSAVQLLTGSLHALSFVAGPQASNATEEQLVHLMTTYRQDAGAGFKPTTYEMFTALSACFTLICIMAAWLNIYLLRQKITPPTLRGVAGINAVIFGVCFGLMAMFTFLPPILLTGIIFLLAILAWWVAGKQASFVDD